MSRKERNVRQFVLMGFILSIVSFLAWSATIVISPSVDAWVAAIPDDSIVLQTKVNTASTGFEQSSVSVSNNVTHKIYLTETPTSALSQSDVRLEIPSLDADIPLIEVSPGIYAADIDSTITITRVGTEVASASISEWKIDIHTLALSVNGGSVVSLGNLGILNFLDIQANVASAMSGTVSTVTIENAGVSALSSGGSYEIPVDFFLDATIYDENGNPLSTDLEISFALDDQGSSKTISVTSDVNGQLSASENDTAILTVSGGNVEGLASAMELEQATGDVSLFWGGPTNYTISGYVKTPDGNSVSGVTLSLSGKGTAATNSSGYYSKSIAEGWSGTVTPSKTGYDFNPKSKAYSNLSANLSNQNFTAYPQDEGEADIAGINVKDLTETSATIAWVTVDSINRTVYRNTICDLEYGTSTSYGDVVSGDFPKSIYSVTLSDLGSNTEYHFRIKCTDPATGTTIYSNDDTFTPRRRNVTLKSFEINQCFQKMQGLHANYDLIETKPFVVRIGLDSDETRLQIIKVSLDIYDSAGNQIGDTKEVARVVAFDHILPGNIDFLFKDSETASIEDDTYTFSLLVQDISDTQLLQQNVEYSFVNSKDMKFLVRNVKNNGQTAQWEESKFLKFIREVYPLPKNRIIVHPQGTVPTEDASSFDLSQSAGRRSLADRLNKIVQEHNRQRPNNRLDFIVGVVPTLPMPGIHYGGYLNGLSSVLIEDGSDEGQVAAVLGHEVGHFYGFGEEYVSSRKKDSNGLWELDETFKFADNPPPLIFSSNGPYKLKRNDDKRADKADGEGELYAKFDWLEAVFGHLWCKGWYVGEGGYNVGKDEPISSKTIAMMGGSSKMWISGTEYGSLIRKFKDTVTSSTSLGFVQELSSVANRISIMGSVNIPSLTGGISSLLYTPNENTTPEALDSVCHLAFLSENGSKLGTHRFKLVESEEFDSIIIGTFATVVDLPDGTFAIQLVIDGFVADELHRTAHKPNVSIISPNGGEQISNTLTISWAGSDLDNDQISYSILFSHNGGVTWHVIAVDVKNTQYIIDTKNLQAGGNKCLVKIIVSDGWNSSEDISDSHFSVRTKAPIISIFSPTDGDTFLECGKIQGHCKAIDPETGELTKPNAITWLSDRDGIVGTGRLTAFSLSPGDHILTVEAIDPDGMTTTKILGVSVIADTDCDNMPDDFETEFGLDPNSDDSCNDLDGDGLPNRYEMTIGTNPATLDTDGDGTWDNVELAEGTDPKAPGHPPVADAGSDHIVEQTSSAGATVSLDGSASTDEDGDVLTYHWSWNGGEETGVDPAILFPLGITSVTLTVDDGFGNVDSDDVVILVQDSTPPVVDAGGDMTVEQAALIGTEVIVTGSSADICDAEVDYEWSEDGVVLGNSPTLTHTFNLGTHVLTLKAIDDSGNAATDTVTITVVDTTPPDFTFSVSPTTLWPPNHKYVLITPFWTASDICDASIDVTLKSIVNNEEDDTNTYDSVHDGTVGDGHTNNDIKIEDDGSIYLRAERSGIGTGSGRVYTITYQATDDSGNVVESSATVTVPHDMD